MNLKSLVGAGDKIGWMMLPFVFIGLLLNIQHPSDFSVGGPSVGLGAVSVLVSIAGVVIWMWSVFLILTRVPKGELITHGPYSIVKHPLYTSVALLVLPWVGFLLNTWLGLVFGVLLYIASRIFSPAEEAELARKFGRRWDDYRRSVKFPWL